MAYLIGGRYYCCRIPSQKNGKDAGKCLKCLFYCARKTRIFAVSAVFSLYSATKKALSGWKMLKMLENVYNIFKRKKMEQK